MVRASGRTAGGSAPETAMLDHEDIQLIAQGVILLVIAASAEHVWMR